MKEVERERERTLVECCGCGKRGYYPVGGAGCLNVEEVMPNAQNPPEHSSDVDCWCKPEEHYVDPITGCVVWVHREIQ
jgi:hypothetical protein